MFPSNVVCCAVFVVICIEYLDQAKDEKIDLTKKNINLFICRLVNKKVISFSSNMRRFSHDLPKNLRKTCTVTIHKNMLQSSKRNSYPTAYQ